MLTKNARTVTRVMTMLLGGLLLAACDGRQPAPSGDQATAGGGERTGPIRVLEPQPEERHFGQLRMLTDGGENAEAYFSFSGRELVYQATIPPYECDQIFTMDLDGTNRKLVSTGRGRTTCAYFLPGDEQIIYSSTHHHMEACPPPPDHSQGYVWALYPEYDIFVVNRDGTGLRQLTDTWGYDAEATVSPRGDRIVFTSMRDGDLDIYTMNLDGTDVRRLTDDLGYDGGPFFSPDGTKIVYRAWHPKTEEEIADYRRLLEKNLIRPSKLELFVMDADGSNKQQITDFGMASFGPFFHPSGEKVIFSTNYPDGQREFDLYMVNLDGTGVERVTWSPEFDGFPMFSPDGKLFVFASNRDNSKRGETNIFITDWR